MGRVDEKIGAERIPPHNLEAEMSVLGSILLTDEVLADVLGIVSEDDFYQPRHKTIFGAVKKLTEKGLAIDHIVLLEHLRREGTLELVGGKEYLIQLEEFAHSSMRAVPHAKIVKENSLLRKLINHCYEISEDAYNGRADVGDFLDEAEQRIFSVTEQNLLREPVTVQAVLEQVFQQIDQREGVHRGLEMGYYDLDNLTTGMNPGEFIIVAGRPSMGKTAFVLNVVEHVAIQNKKPVAVFSLEMSSQQVVQRLLCSRARVSAQKLRENRLSRDDHDKLVAAAGELQGSQIFVDDTAGLSALQIRAKARRLKARKGIELVIVDYLQLMEAPHAESRQQEISVISRQMKALARELSIPVVCLSQLNRAADNRDDKRPKLADLRESGAIEQDADVVMMLYREEYYYQDREDAKGKAEVHVAKQRNGPTGSVTLGFRSEYMRFENLASMAGSSF